MGRQPHRDRPLDDQDEHNAPTEPLPPLILPSFLPPESPNEYQTIPAPQPDERPFPLQDRNPAQVRGLPPHPPESPVYPYLPPAPAVGKGDRPAGGAVPVSPVGARTFQGRRRRSALPFLVHLFFIAVEWLLLARFVLKMINLPSTTSWVGLIYDTSNVFVQPFRQLLQGVTFPLPASIEVYTLLALIAYWIFSRILVPLLKALLRSR